MKYSNITPATGWCFCGVGPSGPIVFPIAVWAQTEEGEVIGLISIMSEPAGHRVAKLIPLPSINGQYKRETELSIAEFDSLRKS